MFVSAKYIVYDVKRYVLQEKREIKQKVKNTWQIQLF